MAGVVRQHLLDTRGGCTAQPGRPAAGAPRPPSPCPLPFASPPVPVPHPACPRWSTQPAPSLDLGPPPAPGPLGWEAFICLCPSPCVPHPCLPCCRWRMCPSRAPASVPCRVLCPALRRPCPCLSRAPVLLRCCLHWCPARAHAPLCRRGRPGPSLVSVPFGCCPRLCPPLVPFLLLRLPPSLGRPRPLAPRLRGLHPAPPDRRPALPGPRATAAAAA